MYKYAKYIRFKHDFVQAVDSCVRLLWCKLGAARRACHLFENEVLWGDGAPSAALWGHATLSEVILKLLTHSLYIHT